MTPSITLGFWVLWDYWEVPFLNPSGGLGRGIRQTEEPKPPRFSHPDFSKNDISWSVPKHGSIYYTGEPRGLLRGSSFGSFRGSGIS